MLKILLLVTLVTFVKSEGQADKDTGKAWEKPSLLAIDAVRDAEATEVANKKLKFRNAQFDAIRTAVAEGKIEGVSTNLGAHHQLNFLTPSLQDVVAKAEYYNDYIDHYVEGLTEKNADTALNFDRLKINKVFPGNGHIPTYPNCSKECNNTGRYRTLDGRCNHLTYCVWGATGTSMRRLLPPTYGKNNSPRPANIGAWRIAHKQFRITRGLPERITSARNLSQMTMTFGQFLAHDVVTTPIRSAPNTDNSPLEVDCTNLTEPLEYQDCYMLVRKNIKRNFIRSAPGIIDKLNQYVFGRREQMNVQTAFIDASHIYGVTERDRDRLYDRTTGKLREKSVSPVKSEQFPPTDAKQYCEGTRQNECFISGDNRMNINLGIMMLHTLFLREHNYIAEHINKTTNMSGPQIFEEARRIIGSYLQSITYNDYLPLIIGSDLMTKYEMNPVNGTEYDPSVDPSIINSFTTAAFRFGHSQIYNILRMAEEDGTLKDKASQYSTFFRPDRFYAADGYRTMFRYLLGLAHDKCDAVDINFGSSIIFRLFKSKTPKRPSHTRKTSPLPAINIQRGRDHGLPDCGAWMDFIKETYNVTPAQIDDKKTRDKDLFHCGLEEDHMPGAEVGPIFGHIIATQFKRISAGDRYFYSHTNSTSDIAFTPEQRAEIEKVSLAQLICRHVNTVRPGRNPRDLKIVSNVFEAPHKGNKIVDCDQDILPQSPDISKLLS